MSDYETYIVVLGTRQGKRYADRKPLHVPLALATGTYEALSDLQVREFINDLTAEQQRRTIVDTERGGFDPFATQYRGGT